MPRLRVGQSSAQLLHEVVGLVAEECVGHAPHAARLLDDEHGIGALNQVSTRE